MIETDFFIWHRPKLCLWTLKLTIEERNFDHSCEYGQAWEIEADSASYRLRSGAKRREGISADVTAYAHNRDAAVWKQQ